MRSLKAVQSWGEIPAWIRKQSKGTLVHAYRFQDSKKITKCLSKLEYKGGPLKATVENPKGSVEKLSTVNSCSDYRSHVVYWNGK